MIKKIKKAIIIALSCMMTISSFESINTYASEMNENNVTRVYGENRYLTSYASASMLKEELNIDKFDSIILACGTNFPDALSGTYLAKKINAPIYLVNEKYPNTLKAYVDENLKDGGTIYVLGGDSSIPDKLLKKLTNYNIKRLSGSTRYETNLQILEEAGVKYEDIIVCSGKDYPDSLAASATGNPILLVGNSLTSSQKAFIKKHNSAEFYIIGGTGTVNEEIENYLAEYGTVERVSGKNRYDTSVKIAEKFFKNPDEVILAYAYNFPDGLSAGPLAATKNIPILLISEDRTEMASEYVKENNINKGIILGGSSLITDDMAKEVFDSAIITNYKWNKLTVEEKKEIEIDPDSIIATYSDKTCDITIIKEWYENAWCYAAHLEFTDYTRFGTTCANGKYNKGTETTTSAAKRVGAMFAVNGCYSAPSLNYTVVRSGVLWNGSGRSYVGPAAYSSVNGLFLSAWETGGTPGIVGENIDKLVSSGKVTDTFCFGAPFLKDGVVSNITDTGRAQRTSIGTNGDPGDIWIVVSDGRLNDGKSTGLTMKQCAQYLKNKGCTFGIPLDGGGSSTMVWNGKVLNANTDQRAVVDFVYFK